MPHTAAVETEGRPIVTVDVALFTLLPEEGLAIVLGTRDRDPFAGRPALFGGFLRPGSDGSATDAAHRLLAEKAGLADVFVEQLMTFSGPDRDPRGWSVSIAYYALVPFGRLAEAKPGLAVWPVGRMPPLAFDHDRIAAAALARLGGKASYSTLPAFLLPKTFTLPELKAVYEAVLGTALNDSAFRRKVMEMRILEEVPEKRGATAGVRRPAQLWRLAADRLVEFDRTV